MFRLFDEGQLGDYLNEKRRLVHYLVENEPELTILKADEYFINHIIEKEYVEVPQFNFEEIYVEDVEKIKNGNPEMIFNFKLSFTGDKELLKLKPTNHINWTIDANVEKDHVLCFEIIDNDEDITVIKDKFRITVDNIKKQLENFADEVEAYNNQLPVLIGNKLKERKNRIIKRKQKLELLNSLENIEKRSSA